MQVTHGLQETTHIRKKMHVICIKETSEKSQLSLKQSTRKKVEWPRNKNPYLENKLFLDPC